MFISRARDQQLSPAKKRLAGTDPPNSDTTTAVCVCVRGGGGGARVRASACARMCVRPFVRACVMCLLYIFVNNI